MQRFRAVLEPPIPSALVATGAGATIIARVIMAPDAFGAWVRFADVPASKEPNEYDAYLSLVRKRQIAEAERDAALKLVEERSLAARKAEEALRVDSSFRHTWRVERERRLVADAELADCRRVYGEACAEIEKQKGLAGLRAGVAAIADQAQLRAKMAVAERDEARRQRDALAQDTFDKIQEALGAPLDAGWSYDMAAAPGYAECEIAVGAPGRIRTAVWQKPMEGLPMWIEPLSGQRFPDEPYAWRRVQVPPRQAAQEG